MKDEELYKLFTDKAGENADQPPKHLWDRLEGKLDTRKAEKRVIFFRRTAIAASIALVIGLAATLPIFNPPGNKLAVADEQGSLTAMNDEVIVNDFNSGFIMTKKEQESFYQSQEEIKNYQKISRDENKQLAFNDEEFQPLKPKQASKSNAPGAGASVEEITASPKADAIPKKIIEEEKPLQEIAATKTEVVPTNPPEERVEMLEEVAIVETKNPALGNAIEEAREDDIQALSDDAFADIAEPEAPKKEEKEYITALQTQKKTAKEVSERQKTKGRSAKKQDQLAKSQGAYAPPSVQSNTMDLNLQNRAIDYQYTNSIASDQQSIEQLDWILGKWSDPSGKSYETWVQKDELTIEGKGFFIVNQDTLFTEKMKIRQLEDGLYFIVATDDSQQDRYFRLKSLQNYMAVFEERDNNNEQVILQRQNDDNFLTIYQNQDVTPLNESQQNFLNNRNVVAPNNRATRSLRRVQH